jgi:signal transduction histidine kinase
LATGEAQPPYLVEVRHKAGHTVVLEIRERPVVVEGEVTGLIGLAHDVTERLSAQDTARVASDALRHKNRELENIIHVASHDLRSPLVGIEGFSSELGELWAEVRGRLPPDDAAGEEISFMIEHIRRGAERMDRRLAGLLQLSRLGRLDLDKVVIDMDAMVGSIVDEFAFQLRDAGATLTVGELPPCRGDRFGLGQVFTNLVDNAIKYLRPDAPGQVRVEGEQLESVIRYRVFDNGVGIKPAFRKRVFEIFHRLDPRWCQGEGLGLTIAQRIALLHDGRIEVGESPLGGACFELTLPV